MKSLLKRNAVKHLICIVLTVVITAGFIPLRAEADTTKYVYKFISLKQNKYVTSRETTYSYNEKTDTNIETCYLHKISVPANGYIKINANRSERSIDIYKTINRKKSLWESYSIISLYGKKAYYEVLPKGTYYIKADSSVKFKWSFVKVQGGSNYCRARARRLAAWKKIVEIFNYGQEYNRWYMISLPRKKTITVTYSFEPYDPVFAVYNSHGIKLNCPSLTNRSWRTALLPKGTYYIRISRDRYEDEYSFYRDRFVQFWWN